MYIFFMGFEPGVQDLRCFSLTGMSFACVLRFAIKDIHLSPTKQPWGKTPWGFYEVKGDLEMLRNDGLGPEDPQTALKQRLLDLTKKNRRLQVTLDGQRVRLQQLEIEVKKPKEEAKKQAEEISFVP